MVNTLASLGPVLILGLAGWASAKARSITPSTIPALSQLVFYLLTPALLFRTMVGVDIASLDFRVPMAYFGAVMAVFVLILILNQPWQRGTVRALTSTFSNLGMIGIPLIGLAYGPEGLITLFTLISVHSLILLTSATLAMESALAADKAQAQASWVHALTNVGKGTLTHPVLLPIAAGLVWGKTGLGLHPIFDSALRVMGEANGPMSLILVGATLAHTSIGPYFRTALKLSLIKLFALPTLVCGVAYLVGIRGTALAVMTTAAAMPTGANVFLFSQRYQTETALTTATVGTSTLLAWASTALAMTLTALIPR